ncbi:MAG: hypothetical protein JSS09_09300 [Verrucomicrobia bacterium]|nr:hypothetical protein [Verrucomicrobiota bacterium]
MNSINFVSIHPPAETSDWVVRQQKFETYTASNSKLSLRYSCLFNQSHPTQESAIAHACTLTNATCPLAPVNKEIVTVLKTSRVFRVITLPSPATSITNESPRFILLKDIYESKLNAISKASKLASDHSLFCFVPPSE